MASLVAQMVKKLPAMQAGDLGSIPGLGRSAREGNGNPLQCSCLENPMDRGAWRAAVHGVERARHGWMTANTVTNFDFPHPHALEFLLKCGFFSELFLVTPTYSPTCFLFPPLALFIFFLYFFCCAYYHLKFSAAILSIWEGLVLGHPEHQNLPMLKEEWKWKC